MSTNYKQHFLEAAQSSSADSYKRLKFIFWNHAQDIKKTPELMGQAFIAAIKAGNAEHYIFLGNNGADLDFQDTNGNTALMHAVETGNGDLARELLRAGANPLIVNLQTKMTAKDYAQSSGYGGIYNLISQYEKRFKDIYKPNNFKK